MVTKVDCVFGFTEKDVGATDDTAETSAVEIVVDGEDTLRALDCIWVDVVDCCVEDEVSTICAVVVVGGKGIVVETAVGVEAAVVVPGPTVYEGKVC